MMPRRQLNGCDRSIGLTTQKRRNFDALLRAAVLRFVIIDGRLLRRIVLLGGVLGGALARRGLRMLLRIAGHPVDQTAKPAKARPLGLLRRCLGARRGGLRAGRGGPVVRRFHHRLAQPRHGFL